MIAIVEHGLDVGAGEIGLQVWASLLKFHASYLGLFLLGWVLPPDGASARALGVLLRWVQWPVGFAIYLVPAELARVLVFGRFSFFVAALLLLATAFRPSAAGSGGRA
jgi:hypothetical protein